MSARSIALMAWTMLYFSRVRLIRLFRRMPAVSIRRNFFPLRVKGVSMASRVVPGTGFAIVRS